MLDLNQNFAALSKAMAAPFAELHNINSRIAEQLTRDYVEMASSSMANAIKHMQASLKIRDAEDFVKSNLDYATDTMSKFLGSNKDACKIIDSVAKDYRKWAEDNATEIFKEYGMSNTDCGKKKV